MQDEGKTKQQLLKEINELRVQISELESSSGKGIGSDIFDSIKDGICIIDTGMNILLVNKTMKEWYSHSLPLEGKKCFLAYHGRKEPCEICPSIRTIKSGKQDMDIVPMRENGAIKGWIELHTFPLIDSKTGGLSGVIEYVRDITERVKTERALIEEKSKLQAVLSGIGDGISIQDRDFKIIYQNGTHIGMFGEHTGRHCYEAYAGKKGVCEGCPLAKSFKDGKIYKDLRKKDTKDGDIHMEVTASPVRDGSGNIIAGVEVVRDITERMRMESELIKTQKLESLGIMAGGISHEFNNILTAIIGNITLAKMYANPKLEIYDILTEAEKASERAKDLTKQLLTFSRGGEPVKKIIELYDIIKSSSFMRLSRSNIKCKCEIPDDLWPLEVDEGQVVQAVNNIIKNAEQAMPGGGSIAIGAGNVYFGENDMPGLGEGKYVMLSISDSGSGVPDEHLSKVFDPFFTTKTNGSGLGLATAYSIIKKHGGHIVVESTPGEGSVFTVFLPASVEMPPKRKEGKRAAIHGKGRILVMDDEEMVRTVMGRLLNQCGYDVEFAKDGTEAIDVYRKADESGKAFDVVIMDLVIQGGMGGEEAIRRLIEIDPGIKAIVSSGYSNDPIMANYKDHGFRGVLKKPFQSEELSRVLYQTISGEA